MNQSKTGSRTNLTPIILVGLGLAIIIGIAFFTRLTQGMINDTGSSFNFAPVELDQPAPKLTLSDLDGREVSLTDFHGEVVLLNNWATWCPPCRLEMPEFQSYYQKHKNQGFQVVAIEAGDPEEVVRDFVEAAKLEFVILLDPENKSLAAFQHTTLPNSFVIDREGQIRYAWLGAIDETILEEYVTPLLKE